MFLGEENKEQKEAFMLFVTTIVVDSIESIFLVSKTHGSDLSVLACEGGIADFCTLQLLHLHLLAENFHHV
jgi:hypothetical protein